MICGLPRIAPVHDPGLVRSAPALVALGIDKPLRSSPIAVTPLFGPFLKQRLHEISASTQWRTQNIEGASAAAAYHDPACSKRNKCSSSSVPSASLDRIIRFAQQQATHRSNLRRALCSAAKQEKYVSWTRTTSPPEEGTRRPPSGETRPAWSRRKAKLDRSLRDAARSSRDRGRGTRASRNRRHRQAAPPCRCRPRCGPFRSRTSATATAAWRRSRYARSDICPAAK